MDKLQQDYEQLKYCPVCGKRLKASPNSGLKCCFAHGDFDCVRRSIVWATSQLVAKRIATRPGPSLIIRRQEHGGHT